MVLKKSQTSSRPRDVGGSFASRRGHANTLSISDPSHHVTEAIGTLYGSDDNDSDTESRENRKSRPLSFLSYGEDELPGRHGEAEEAHDPRHHLQRSHTDDSHLTPHDPNIAAGVKKANTLPSRMSMQRNPSYESGSLSPTGSLGPMSPTLSLRDVQAAEGSMSMTNIDNPNDIAQELSNLQALRRMSMDVGNNSDPDLIPFQGIVPIPSIAPSGDDDESDPSRLLWVPANVHPELAPEQFKSFLERRVNSMKRMSGESMLSTEGLPRSDSIGLRRTKSKLSRQIDNSGGRGGDGYVDGAERLERQKSLNGYATPELSLDELVKDPTRAVQKLTQDASDGAGSNDVILPVAPGMGLRRSTRTQYRKSGSMRSDRAPFSKRIAQKLSESHEEPLPSMPKVDAPPEHGLSRTQTEPDTVSGAENYSRPTRSVRRQQGFSREAQSSIEAPSEPATQEQQEQTHGRNVSDPEETSHFETPSRVDQPGRQYPERSSSQKSQAQISQESHAPQVPQHRPQERVEQHTSIRTNKQPPPGRQGITPAPLDNVPGNTTQTLNDITSPTLPGPGSSRTDNLTMIPTFTESEKKKARDSDSESTKSSSGWKWFKSEDKKKKDKDKDKDKEDQTRRSRLSKSAEKPHENARLDVLQNSIENVVSKGRESLLLDRDSIDNKLHEERKKESSRKSHEGKKDRDGFFGSIFGGKKKGDRDVSSKKQQRPASPEPPPMRQLKPDVDYPYTRFPILEERAIYRMAHIKLANPKRNLLSQVLLSNFMYSYLAKIQAMHPQLQVPVSPQQKRLDEERRRKEEEAQQAYMEQQMQQQQAAQNSIDQYNFEYHRVSSESSLS